MTNLSPRPCGVDSCCVSTDIFGHLTFGRGKLDDYGYWARPCGPCARAHEKAYPDDGACWPFEPDAPSEATSGAEGEKL